MIINRDNIDKIVLKMYEYYKNSKVNNLASVEFPNEIEYKSNEWLIYVFYSCLLDYGMKSQNYHNNLINTYHKYQQIFNPKYVIKNFFTNKEKLISIMRDNIHPRYPNIAVDKWINLSKELSNYESLINKINTFSSFEELNNFIRNINGYGQKTGGLLLRLIYEANICNFTYELGYIPLDRHDIEISYLNNIIDKRKLSNKEIEELSNLYIASGKKIGLGADFIDKYLWNIGNDFCNKKNCLNCPLNENCQTKLDR